MAIVVKSHFVLCQVCSQPGSVLIGPCSKMMPLPTPVATCLYRIQSTALSLHNADDRRAKTWEELT